MTPHLHPRSRMTTSLFGTTLLVSFAVVSVPHILPCPAPRVRLADAELETEGHRGKRRRPEMQTGQDNIEDREGNQTIVSTAIPDEEIRKMRQLGHECPVPKPSGFIGRILGFGSPDADRSAPQKVEPAKIEVRQRESDYKGSR